MVLSWALTTSLYLILSSLPENVQCNYFAGKTMTTTSTFYDLSTWYLTLPVDRDGETSGDAATIKNLETYQSDWFSHADEGALTFTVNVDGATTKNTKYARSELREMDGEDLAWWNLSEGGTMTGTLAVTEIHTKDNGGPGRVIVAQIHGKSQELVRLYWDNGSLYFKNDQAGPDDRELKFELLNASGEKAELGLGEVFSYEINARGDVLDVAVHVDGETFSSTSKISSVWQSDKFYFKAGAYLGENESKADGSTTVSYFGLDISHVEGEGLRGLLILDSSNEKLAPVSEVPVAEVPDETGQIIGDDSDNVLIGTAAGDHMIGHAGNDAFLARGGVDTMEGGLGDDRYYVDSADDQVIELAGEGNDTVHSIASITLSANVENVVLRLERAIDAEGNDLANRMTGNSGDNVLSGLGGNDIIRGEGGNDKLLGGVGRDYLYGGEGKDALEGGAGSDRFIFDTRLDGGANVDTILDFSAAQGDRVLLSHDIFSAIGDEGRLAKTSFYMGSAARDADDRIVYDSAIGELFYDADGSGAVAAVLFAVLEPGSEISNVNFYVF